MALVQVFIPSHNRPKSVIKTVESVLNQSFMDYELIISDNSTNNQTNEIFAHYNYSNVKYIKREPALTSIEHFNRILSEVTSEFFMIFHDDDVMHENMIECLYNSFIEHQNIFAVGANAFIVRNGKNSNKKIFRTSKNDLVLSNPIDVAKQYAAIGGIVPFPSYMYKKEVAQKLRFDLSKGGKYCDAAFILDISTLGKIIFLERPTMDYSIHSGQDSQNYSYRQCTELLTYIRKVTGLRNNNKVIREFRIQNIYLDLKQGIQNRRISLLSRKYLRSLNILFRTSLFLYFPRILVLSFIHTLKFSISEVKLSSDSSQND